MPATDPINQNVHPLIYRWNGILGQAQAAALEAAGKEGIIYNSTYTNFWQGAMAWSGWWHNQVGLLTEVASARIASPIEQRKALPGQQVAAVTQDFQSQQRRQMENPNEPAAAVTSPSHRVPAAVARREMDSAGYRRLRIDRDDGVARNSRRSSRAVVAPDL
jgi:hypothetical protein